jgi:hypothetical protein
LAILRGKAQDTALSRAGSYAIRAVGRRLAAAVVAYSVNCPVDGDYCCGVEGTGQFREEIGCRNRARMATRTVYWVPDGVSGDWHGLWSTGNLRHRIDLGMNYMTEKDRRNAAKLDAEFARVVQAFTRDRRVSHGGTKGFGAGALKVDGKIFAMISSKGEFVVKLPRARVEEMATAGEGKRFDPGHGRIMKEWLVLRSGSPDWVEVAKEACEFVKQGKRTC